MKTLQKILLLLTTSVIIACNSTSKEQKLNDTITDTTNSISSNIESQDKPTINTAKDSVFTIKFDDMNVSINAFIETDDDFFNAIQKDTLQVQLGLDDENIQNKLISIIQNSLTILKVEQRYETSYAVYFTDDDYVLLDNWKHYSSDWRDLIIKKEGKYLYQEYPYEESNIAPDVTSKNLKQKLLNDYPEKFKNIADSTRLPLGYYVENYISGYYLRIVGKRNSDGKIVTKLIIFTPPYGC